MPFKLALAVVVYPPTDSDDHGLNIALLQKANAWLQRRNAGFEDDLFLIGIGFADESALQAMVRSYGLGDAQLRVEQPDRDDDGVELGECVGRAVSHWVAICHSTAVPIVNWKKFVGNDVYPLDGWWWVGLEAVDDEQASTLEVILRGLVPDAFRETAMTWGAVIAASMNLSAIGENHEVYEAYMSALTLARWLNGFDAATENNFFDFCAPDAMSASGLDPLRLGFEAGRNHDTELDELVFGDDADNDGLNSALLLACLRDRNGGVRDALSTAFGGNPALFWSLYASIWPEFKKPMTEAMDDLLNLRTAAEEGDLDRPWQFVTDGWIEFSEE